GRAFGRGHRPWQTMRPAIKEGLDVGRTEGITGVLESGRVGTGQEPVVEALETNAAACEPLLHPFMAIETELHRIREIAPDITEGGNPVAVMDVDVVEFDGVGHAREVRDGCMT